MKSKRHSKILEIIAEYEIDTQEELLDKLSDNGFNVTQATVSRDIKELRLIKVQSPGGYKYAIDGNRDTVDMSFKFHAVFAEAVTGIDCAENIAVIRCYPGMANAACAALDGRHYRRGRHNLLRYEDKIGGGGFCGAIV
jgi:transcriptional regulator of arginine metabolism